MAEYQLDPRPYFTILHSVLRHDELDSDNEAVAACVHWVVENAATLRKVCSTSEFRVIMTHYAYWDKHKVAPSRDLMTTLVRQGQQPEGLLDVLTAYDEHAEDLKVLTPLDLHNELDQRKDAFNKHKLSKILDQAAHITVGSATIRDEARRVDVQYVGPSGALRYLSQRMQEGLLLDSTPAKGGALADTADKIASRYDKTEADLRNNNLFIPTGLPLIDNHLGGLRRKEVNGILGYVGQRKSGVCRHIAYSAAALGFRVLYIPIESDYDEEENAQLAMHASYCVRGHHGITKSAIERGKLSLEDRELLPTVAESLKRSVAQNIIVWEPGESRSWADIRSIIERETHKDVIDLVVIDYLTLLSTPGARDDIADKLAIIQDAKRLAMTANRGHGLSILTPVQGNRDGFEDAGQNDGVWSTTGIAKYSELDKSLDNCFTVWFSTEMEAENRMKIGSCKTRRDKLIPATLVSIDPGSGRIRQSVERDVAPASRPAVLSQDVEDMKQHFAKDVIPDEVVL